MRGGVYQNREGNLGSILFFSAAGFFFSVPGSMLSCFSPLAEARVTQLATASLREKQEKQKQKSREAEKQRSRQAEKQEKRKSREAKKQKSRETEQQKSRGRPESNTVPPPPKLPGHFEAVSEADGHDLKSCQGRPSVTL